MYLNVAVLDTQYMSTFYVVALNVVAILESQKCQYLTTILQIYCGNWSFRLSAFYQLQLIIANKE